MATKAGTTLKAEAQTRKAQTRTEQIGKARIRKAETPWGAAGVLEEVKLSQRVGEKRFSTIVQLLETGDGEQLVRIAYTTDGVVRRGPVTLRARELERLRSLIETRPALAAAVGLGGEA